MIRHSAGSPLMLVVELEGAPQIAAAAESLGWQTHFISTNRYAAWLPAPDAAWAASQTGRVTHLIDPSFLELFEIAEMRGARSVLPISLLEPECLRDALLRDHADRAHTPLRVVANRASAVETTYDKWLTKQALPLEFFVVPGRAVSSGEELLAAVAELGAPVVVKPRRDFTGHGVRIFESLAQAEAFVRKSAVRSLLVERYLEGSEVSVEIVRDGNVCLAQPVVYKGETRLNVVEHPVYRPRVAPWRPDSIVARRVTSAAIAIATELRLEGALEIEFIVTDDGTPYLMEVNPRVSGVTRLAMAAGGHDTFAALVRMAAGVPLSAQPAPGGAVAMALPITVDVSDPRVVAASRSAAVRYVKPIDWMPLLPIRGSLVLQAESVGELAGVIEELAPLTNDVYHAQALAALTTAIPESLRVRRAALTLMHGAGVASSTHRASSTTYLTEASA